MSIQKYEHGETFTLVFGGVLPKGWMGGHRGAEQALLDACEKALFQLAESQAGRGMMIQGAGVRIGPGETPNSKRLYGLEDGPAGAEFDGGPSNVAG